MAQFDQGMYDIGYTYADAGPAFVAKVTGREDHDLEVLSNFYMGAAANLAGSMYAALRKHLTPAQADAWLNGLAAAVSAVVRSKGHPVGLGISVFADTPPAAEKAAPARAAPQGPAKPPAQGR